jgi:hypothetical protein
MYITKLLPKGKNISLLHSPSNRRKKGLKLFPLFKVWHKNLKLLLLMVLFLFSFSDHLLSQVSVNINDTTIYRGENLKVKIPVFAKNIPNQTINELRIIFLFQSQIIDIFSSSSTNNTVMKLPKISLANYTPPDSARLTVVDSNIITPVSKDTLCFLEIEGLVASDSIAYLSVEKLYINGKDTKINTKTATIKVLGPPIFKILPEGFGQNYPNPFYYDTKIRFNLKDSTKVEFLLYSTAGEFIESSAENNQYVKYYFYNSKEIQIDYKQNMKIPKGEYLLQIIPLDYKFASGAYYIIMKTESGIYTKSIMYFK